MLSVPTEKGKTMELEFLTVLVGLYKGLAFIVLFCVGLSAVFAPMAIFGVTENPLWLLLYLISPLVITVCYKLLWLL